MADEKTGEEGRPDEPAPSCPRCGGKTEPGWFGSESFVGGTKWFRERNFWGTGGEPLKKPDLSGMIYHLAHRCQACRVIVLKY